MALEFEKPIIEIEQKIAELRKLNHKHVDFDPEIKKLEQKMEEIKAKVYHKLTAWQRIQIARHT